MDVTPTQWIQAASGLSRRIMRLSAQVQNLSGISPNFTENAPNNHPDLLAAWERAKVTGRLDIWNGASDTAIYAAKVNWQFRFWHDMGHIAHGLTFSPEDERELQERHHVGELLALGLEDDSLPIQLYRADTIGQIEYLLVHDEFPVNQAEFARTYVLDPHRALETKF